MIESMVDIDNGNVVVRRAGCNMLKEKCQSYLGCPLWSFLIFRISICSMVSDSLI